MSKQCALNTWPKTTKSKLQNIFSLDLRSLALFRIGLAATLVIDLLFRASDLRFFYTDEGCVTRADIITASAPWTFSLHFANGSWQFQALLFLCAALAHACLLVGYQTKGALACSLLLLISLHRRNPLVLQGGDHLISCLCFWAMFVPLGARFSVDAWKNRIQRKAAVNQSERSLSVGGVCLQLQVILVYLFAAALKAGYPWRGDYSAVYYALNIEPLTTDFGRQLLRFPELLRWMTFAVIQLETFVPFLVFVPWRNDFFRGLTVLIFLSFHAGLALTMHLGPFPYVSMLAWLIFIPSSFWRFFSDQKADVGTPLTVSPSRRIRGYSLIEGLALLFFFVNVLLWNLRVTDEKIAERYYSRDYDYILSLVGLEQNWGMFAPYPYNWDGWFLIVGTTIAGRQVNLSPNARPEDPLDEIRPEKLADQYRGERWRKYLMSIADDVYAGWRPSFLKAVKHRWDTEHPTDPLTTIDMHFYREITLPNGKTPPEKMLLGHYPPT